MSEGWIKLYRSIRKHWLWEDAEKLKWWIDILLQANHKSRKILIGNDLINIERGSFHTSILKLSERWQVDRKTAKKFLDLLAKDNMLTIETSKKGTTLKVSNYEDYQAISECENPNKVDNSMDNDMDNGMDNSVPIKSQQSGHKQELKNYKNDNNVKEREEWEEEKPPSLPPLSFPTQTHKKFYEQWGENSYRTWFMDAVVIEGEIINISSSDSFKNEVIRSKYKEYLEILTGKKVEIGD